MAAPSLGPAARTLRHTSWVRLGLALALAVALPWLPFDLTPGPGHGALALAAAAMAAIALAGFRATDPTAGRTAGLAAVTDITLATALVASTGGERSAFTFVYVLAVSAAALALSRRAAVATAATASVFYGAVVLVRSVLPVGAFVELPAPATPLELLGIVFNAVTLVGVAIAGGAIGQRWRGAQVALDRERRDLAAAQALRDRVFEAVTTGLVVLDQDGRVRAVNPAVERMSGVPAAAVLGRPWEALFAGPALPASATASAAAPESAGQEMALARLDGGTLPARVTASPVRDHTGRPLGQVVACEDLSSLRAMEDRVRQADRLATLGRLAANMAHEIRNPLAAMTGAVEELVRNPSDSPGRRRLAEIVQREGARLNHLIAAFVAYARPAPLALADVDVAQCLDDVLTLLARQERAVGLTLAREYAPPLSWRLDPGQLRQALWNLCQNAVEAMPAGGELHVGAAVHGATLAIWVGDTGPGVPTATLPHLFEPFFSTKPGGGGLGLALVHRTVTDHGGTVDVCSRPGEGTTVTLSLPAGHA